jgi:hypothetical protein
VQKWMFLLFVQGRFIFHLGFFSINSLEKNPSKKNAHGYYVATNILQFLT